MNAGGKRRSCLITGASGFVGSHLAHALADEGWEVHAVLRTRSDGEVLERDANPMILHRHDGSSEHLYEIVRGVQPDIVFHLAALVLSRHRPQDIEPMITSNILFGTQLLEAMAHAGVACLINTSTVWQHYCQQIYSPTCLYAAMKQAFESILAYYVEAEGLRAITLTLPDTYGPRDRRNKLFSMLRAASASGRVLPMTPGEQLLDLVHIRDVVKGYCTAAERLLRGEVRGAEKYVLTSGNPVSLREVVRRYGEIAGRPVQVAWGALSYRRREMMKPWSGGKPLPGWKAEIGLDEGLNTLVAEEGEKAHDGETE